MPHQEDIRLMAHLMRRAGFGDTREELEERVSKGYEAVVEELLYPERQPAIDDELLYRFFPGYEGGRGAANKSGQLGVPDDQHQTASGREDGPLLASVVRHQQLQGGQSTGADSPDCHLP